MKKAVFYGVSVGPGDPEHITLKAIRAIEACDIIAVPRTHRENSLALDIVGKAVDIKDKEILYLDFAMSRASEENTKKHDLAAEKIEKYLNAGSTVAMLSIGDISLFSTFSYIHERLKDRYECVIIPGVNSFSACAAAAGVSLTQADKPLTIIPGSYESIDDALSVEGNKVIMKSGKEIYDIIKKLKDIEYTVVQNCGLENERILHNSEEGLKDSYFTTIIVKG